jgi:photosystem II stability/assembly factor-like uncharacterized protein
MKVLYLLLLISIACQSPKEQAFIVNENPIWEVSNINSNASLRGLYSLNDSIVWTSGSGSYVGLSKDGGITWFNLSVPNATKKDFRDIHAFSENEVVVMSAGDSAEFYYTSNAGQTWELNYQNYRPGVFFDGMDFWDDGTGLAFSDPVDGQLVFAKSEDFGKTWIDFIPRHLPPAIAGEGGFAASGTSILCFGESSVVIGLGAPEKVRVFRSDDKGENWEAIDTDLQTGEYYGIYTLAKNAGGQLLALGGSFSSAQDGEESAALSDSNGTQWQVISEGMPNVYISGLAFHATLEVGVAVGTEGSFISYDNGSTWIKFSDESFNSVMITENQVIAVGGRGKVGRFPIRIPAN